MGTRIGRGLDKQWVIIFQMRLKSFLISLFLFFNFVGPAYGGQQQGGASYLNWSGAELSPTSSVSQVIQPLQLSPNMYWEMGWHWNNAPDGGYGGIQTKGQLADGSISDLAIFSIWNGIDAVPGSPGSGCVAFGGEGTGFSCRIPVVLVAGGQYKMTIGTDPRLGSNWWTASIQDLGTSTVKILGSIKVAIPNASSTSWNNFIEYWGEEVPCDAVGLASAKFFQPLSSNPAVEFYSPRFSRPTNACVMSGGDTPPSGYVGDAIIRFGGASQAPSTETMPFTKTRQALAAEKAAAEKLALTVKTKTIVCAKRKSVKKVTAINPKCPKGYTKR